MKEVHLYISGRVQGVGFRAAVKWIAEDCHIKGFVRNLSDGRVEICAQGEEERIEEFLKKVQNSGIGRIDRVEREERESSEIYSSFKILRGSAL